MIKLENKRFDETIYQKKLSNGLNVIIVHKPQFRNSVAVLGTGFGAKHLTQSVNGLTHSYSSGIAHFLEHKLFEKKDEDILSVFTNMGANANAFTSYNETVYYFSTTKDIELPLNTLLNFVQSIDLTDEGVEKEKGIIIQEIQMYQHMPFFRLSMEVLESLFIHHPLKFDIAGTQNSVMQITKDELELAYQTNYHPSQLILSIVSPESPEKVLEIIETNQDEKEFKQVHQIVIPFVKEPIEVKREFYEIDMDVNATKYALAFKFSLPFEAELDAYKANLMMQILLDINFSKLNENYQSWIDQNIINDLFVYQIDFTKDTGYIQFVAETDNIHLLKNLILEIVYDLDINEEKLNQIKKRYLGESIIDLSDFESFAISNFRAHLLNSNAFEIIEVLENINQQNLIDFKTKLDFNHFVEVVIRK